MRCCGVGSEPNQCALSRVAVSGLFRRLQRVRVNGWGQRYFAGSGAARWTTAYHPEPTFGAGYQAVDFIH